ncbi:MULTISPECIES: hypothetical protein [unclassified Streptomyces]|uniref:hypothetical protein n=1 Tax=unclassified Streptomyces TaxID=2593676 RepID=UPI0037F74319
MTSSFRRGRSRPVRSHRSVRVAHAVLGGTAGFVWLVLPGMTSTAGAPVAGTAPQSVSAAAPEDDETSTADLVLPLLAVGAAGALAGYGYVRRVRRARTRTTPGGGLSRPASPETAPPAPPPSGPDAQARTALTGADNRLRAARDELGFAEALLGAEAVAPYAAAVREAEAELTAALRMRWSYDAGVPSEPAARRHTLAGIEGRCAEAVRRLDTASGALGELRWAGQGLTAAVGLAEARFRELTGRTAAAQARAADVEARWAGVAVTADVERAKDRLLSASERLNRARQADDSGHPEEAVRHLRAAEGAIAQAAVHLATVDRTAADLREAADLLPAALTDAETELTRIRTTTTAHDATPDTVLAAVRQELTSGHPYDPLDALRRVVTAAGPLTSDREGALHAAEALLARTSLARAEAHIDTHRGTVGATPRTLLAEAHHVPPLQADDLTRQIL